MRLPLSFLALPLGLAAACQTSGPPPGAADGFFPTVLQDQATGHGELLPAAVRTAAVDPAQDPLGRPLVEVEMELLARDSGARDFTLVTAPRITTWEGSRATLQIVNQKAYVSRFDVEITQTHAIADPVVEVHEDGWWFEILPHRSADGLWGAALSFSEATLEEMREFPVRLGKTSVTIQIPESETRTRSMALEPREDALWVIGLGEDGAGSTRMLRVKMREVQRAGAHRD